MGGHNASAGKGVGEGGGGGETGHGPSGASERSQAAHPKHTQFPAQLSLLALDSAPSST